MIYYNYALSCEITISRCNSIIINTLTNESDQSSMWGLNGGAVASAVIETHEGCGAVLVLHGRPLHAQV